MIDYKLISSEVETRLLNNITELTYQINNKPNGVRIANYLRNTFREWNRQGGWKIKIILVEYRTELNIPGIYSVLIINENYE